MDEKKKAKVIQIISDVIRTESKLLHENSKMSDFAKWDSLAHLQIMFKIEKQFKKKVNTSKMGELNTVGKILEFLKY